MILREFYPFRGGIFLLLSILVQAGGNIALAKAMKDSAWLIDDSHGKISVHLLASICGEMLTNGYFWLGLGLLLAFFVFFAIALAELDLSFALPIISVEIVLNVALAAWLLGESVSVLRWAGVALVASGVALVATTGGQKQQRQA